MSADAGYGPKPINQILVAGNPLLQFLRIQDVTDMRPGRLVMKGNSDGEIVVHEVGMGTFPPIGWLGYEQTIKKFRPATVDSEYEVITIPNPKDPEVPVEVHPHAAVLHGGHFIIVARLESGGNVEKGQTLTPAVAAGEVALGLVGRDYIVAIAEESVDASDEALDIMVRSLI